MINARATTEPACAAARDAWRACVRGFLAHAASTPEDLARTLAAAPDFATGWAAKGMFLLLLGRAELRAPAQAALAQAERSGGAGAHGAALRSMLAGRWRAAADRLDAALARDPGDALTLKLVHAIRFVLGDAAGMRASVEGALPPYGQGHPLGGYVQGCAAFAREETGDYALAERIGRDALARAPDDAWGLHAVAHVYEMTGRPDDGALWLGGQGARWAHCNNFGYHVWWHLALFELDRGAFDAALALYDRRIRAERTDDYRDIANAASLLARLSIEGVAVGDRWDELADLAERRIAPGCNVFADLHYALALGGAGRRGAARRLAARLAEDGARGRDDMADTAAAAGAAAAEGLAAFAEGGWRAAHARLTQAATQLQRIGGRHAQRDVFARLRVAAAIRAGLPDAAERALADRAALRPGRDHYAERRRAEIARLRDAAA